MQTRRTLLLSALALGLTSAAAWAAPAAVPSIWEGEKMYTTFAKDGTGIASTQCRDCWQLHQKLAKLTDRVRFIFFPIAYMNIHSEPQATTILTAKDPLAKLEEHFAHYTDIEFVGIRYPAVETLPVDVRNKVWTNTKLHRRSGCRAVPYGVFKNSKGQYVPFDERLTLEELEQLFELK